MRAGFYRGTGVEGGGFRGLRAGFYIRRRPQYHPALDPPPSYIRRRVSPRHGG